MLRHWIRYIQPVSKSNHAMSLGVTCYFIHSVQLQSVLNTRARQPTLSNAFSWKETFQFQTKFQCSSVYHWTQLSIGSGNGMAPYMRKATLWNNVDQDVRRYVTSLGHTASNNEMEFGWHLIKRFSCSNFDLQCPSDFQWASASLATTSNVSSDIIHVSMWLCESIFCDLWLYFVGKYTYIIL